MNRLMILISIMFLISCVTQNEGLQQRIAENKSFEKGKGTALKEQPEETKIIETEDTQIEIVDTKNSYDEKVMEAYRNQQEKRLKDLISSKLAENPKDLFSLNILGAYHYKKGATKLARLVWNRALKDHPTSSAILNNLGLTYHLEEENRALNFYKKALREDSRNPHANFNLGSLYIKYKNYEMAKEPLETAYKKLNTVEAANNYALALQGVGEIDGSIKVYERIIRSKTDDYQALLNYATAIANSGDNYNKAKDALNRARLLMDDKQMLNYIQQIEARMNK